ncbi:phosphoribosylanthranilate isomerase [Dyella jiangningensis]|uniref:phosphoribosylanthranilate isomerase n=1 Tax=Dyella sp. AtDHG13 TaxID=1938897 RepID=UPI00088C76DB|nr:phosphoribosylanthranilate isomerase [Dyella sp. AtDHG13]PXV61608.1 phosphoribosylanthranilate isomerase [Dyella sp. AtDHG13]SDJ69769.1 phosphoribosylanthranilate isomerase [Dyella jiangningensis]
MTRIKCCGMTRVEDALFAAQQGADAIGVVLTARSKRRVSVEQAQTIVRAMPPFVTTVALFMDDDAGFVREAIEAIRPDMAQFHGAEPDDWCAQFGLHYLKAMAMGEGAAALPQLQRYPGAAGLLLDGHGLGEAGGSGKAFDWSLMPRDLTQPLILAGGLNPANVAQAVRLAHPWGVDVASGIESAPGIKDARKLAGFIHAVREADSSIEPDVTRR